ncbi:MAG: OsmC family protein [Rhizobiales bacterium]|nr:OsmC family protein [Hyphomicrobiales bacterium]
MTTATAEQLMTKPLPEPRNGVDTPTLLATISAIGGQPELAEFRFRARNRWVSGTHSRSTMNGYYGAGDEQDRGKEFNADADHTTVLCGNDEGPTPVEYLLHALAACLTAGIGNIAAARGITLHEVESTVEGDMDLRGILGLSDDVRNGYRGVTARFKIRGDAPEEKLRKIVEQSMARSAVFDALTNPTPVAIEVDAG